jgi:hypothetical protein
MGIKRHLEIPCRELVRFIQQFENWRGPRKERADIPKQDSTIAGTAGEICARM